jgi:peptidoglycan/LPS O-acetylase OafA/YrhL
MSLPVPVEQTHLTHPKYRADIDGLRAIAVLSVIGFHAFHNWVKGGFVGVDIFFVISGFLISSIIISSLEKGTFSFTEFYARRVKRIFPALILVMAACFVFGWFTLLADEYKQLGKHIAGGAGFISNILLLNESGYFDNIAETKPLLHLWSLGVEEQFYVIWPLFLWFAWKQRINLLSVAISVGVISFALNIYEVRDGTQSAAAFYSPQTRFWELMTGSILAYMTLHKQNTLPKFKHWLDTRLGRIVYAHEANGATLRNVQSMFGAVLIVVGVLVISKERHFPGWWALLPTLGTLLIIMAGAHAWLNRVVLSNRILVWFGLISFPLYLWHWPLLSFARILEGETPSGVIRIAAVLIAIALAWLTYRLIEKPIRFGKYSQAKTITLLVLMVVVGFLGYNCYERDGLGFRLGKLGFRLPMIFQTLTWTAWDGEELGKEVRVGSCLLNPDQDFTSFNSCRSQPGDENKPLLILWGDSYAAHLYPGYKASFGKTYKIIQRTTSACPPIINMGIDRSPHCKEINDHIFELIKDENPDKVVLAADWTAYDWKKIEITILQLHKMGIKNIDLIGSVPQWNDSLYKQLYLKFRSDKDHELPYRMEFGLNQNFILLDPLLYDLSTRLGVNYLSPRKIMCNELGCITRFGETADTLTTYDAAHLTPMSSRFLVSQFPKK